MPAPSPRPTRRRSTSFRGRPGKGFPLIHAVGAASDRKPRLVDITWGDPDHPKVTLVGKGVVFDTGGLDIKPSSGMLLMKKDMGGAANVLALGPPDHGGRPARSACACSSRPSKMPSPATPSVPATSCQSRKGLTVEIGNTDAEGRLILADALALADEEEPGAAARHGDTDRRRPRRARPRPAALLHR